MIILAVILWHLTLVLALASWRLSPAELPFAAPWSLPPRAWPAVTAVVAAAALVAVVVAWRRATNRRAFAELLVMPAGVLAWLWGRPDESGPHPLDLVWAAAVASVAWALTRRNPPMPRRSGRPRLLAGRRWQAVNAAFVLLPVAVAVAAGGRVSWRSLGLSVALYPLYALIQLALVLALPYPRLALLAGERAAVATCVALFALVHWPNGSLMAATAAGMTFWGTEYRQGRRLVPLALSMGLAATCFTQFLPHDVTAHMRVGPGYVRQRAVPVLATAAAPAQLPPVSGFVGVLYPAVVGRPAAAEELARWDHAADPARRGALAWYFFNTPEYAGRFGAPPATSRRDDATPWTDLDPTWRARIAPFAADAYYRAQGSTWRGFLAGLYRDVLGREAAAADLDAWPQTLSRRERERLVEVLLLRQRDLADAVFDTLTVEELELRY